jgi:L-cysteine/cystine lyase
LRLEAQQAVAGLLNASPDEVCLTKNTTDGLNMVMNGLSWNAGDEIVSCDLEHSSVLVPSFFKQLRNGAVLKVVHLEPNEPRENILAKLEDALTDRTRLVFLSHIEYSSGLRQPVEEIRRMTKDRGIMMLLDGAQTAGHIQLDMKAIDCDFYSIPGQKWLLGSEGVGALYIRQELIPQVEPLAVSGGAVLPHDAPDKFEPNTTSMDKFNMSSSSFALQAGLLAAVSFIQSVGVDTIEQRNLDLATSLKEGLNETPGVTVLSPLDRQCSSGLVSFSIDGIEPAEVVSYLWDEHRIAARRVAYPHGVRASLHFFNTEDEVDRLIGAVRQKARGF